MTLIKTKEDLQRMVLEKIEKTPQNKLLTNLRQRISKNTTSLPK